MSSPPRHPANYLHRISSDDTRPTTRSAAVPLPPTISQRPSSHHHPSEDDLTWLQFLRTAGGTVPDQVQRANSAERKRKNTAAESERRIYPYHTFAGASSRVVPSRYNRPGPAMSPTRAESGTSVAPVDLTTPPRRTSSISAPIDPVQLRRASTNPPTRQESDTVLPKWQPDNSVTSCPVCDTAFAFWNRRHHCRKCGRVVCAACSPHRITIPRQYIVQPPNPYLAEFGLEEVEQRDEQERRGLGGGEVVRVCNPCVPDPWTPEVPSLARTASEEGTARARPLIDGARNASETERQRSDRYRYMPPPTTIPSGTRNRSQSHQPISAPFSRSIPVTHPPFGRPLPSNTANPSAYPPPQPPPQHTRPNSHRYSHSTHIPFPTSSSRPPSAPPQPPAPRRVVKEEDECPVCGIEMPPGEQVREAHIQECIATRFSSGGTPSTTTTALAPPPPRPMSTDFGPTTTTRSHDPSSPPTPSASTPPSTSTSTSHPSRPRAPPRGMALYRATEKDCLDAETQEAVECVICFEEFQPGDELGRMECLCRFHRQCIRGWWERRGGGSCPTHMLHE